LPDRDAADEIRCLRRRRPVKAVEGDVPAGRPRPGQPQHVREPHALPRGVPDGAVLPLDPRGPRLVEGATVAGAFEGHILREHGKLLQVVQAEDAGVVHLALDFHRPLRRGDRCSIVVVTDEEHIVGRVVGGQVSEPRLEVDGTRAPYDEPVLARNERGGLLGARAGRSKKRDGGAAGDQETPSCGGHGYPLRAAILHPAGAVPPCGARAAYNLARWTNAHSPAPWRHTLAGCTR